MKKSHIFIIIIIAVAIGIIVSTAGDASTYVNFDQAFEMAQAGKQNHIHVVGQLKKDREGHVLGIEEGPDKVSFSFVMVDDNGKEQKVEYNEPMPADMLRSEKVVVVGSYEGDHFKASKIILKCPSKYQEQNVNV
ncbi:cytochrome c maturation protein CcmE domain-containing protein [Ohtaekwangia sp.]|uniref:cytochrome c maturation protein CcmE domain-containing protein n=1 Tax=Ohtaekwangia sp. TaxID=2066019 RepID=UPI002F94D198